MNQENTLMREENDLDPPASNQTAVFAVFCPTTTW